MATIPVGAEPVAVVDDPVNGNVYVADSNNNSISVIHAASRTVVGWVTGPSGPSGLALDPSDGRLFVTGWDGCCSGNLTVVNTTSDAVVGTITAGGWNNLDAVAFDSRNGLVYASDLNGIGVSVFNGTSDTFVTNINLSYYSNSFGLAFDPVNGYVYVADSNGRLYIINGATDSVVGSIQFPAGNVPDAVAFDPVNGLLYVSESPCGGFCVGSTSNLTAINPANNQIVHTIPTAVDPSAIAVDASNGNVFVTELSSFGNGSVQNLTGSGNVTEISSTTNRVIEAITVGHVPLAIAYDAGTGDFFVANEGSDSVTAFAASVVTYPVVITESGLSNGTAWFVNVSGGVSSYVNGTSYTFTEPNGTYPMTVQSDAFRYLVAPFGAVAVAGAAVRFSVTFSLNPNSVSFLAVGLAPGTYWSVALNGTASGTASNATFGTWGPAIELARLPGTYTYTVTSGSDWYVARPPTGSVVLDGTPVTVNAPFAQVLWGVNFGETGLAPWTSWYINLTASNNSSSVEGSASNFLDFGEPNGSYHYQLLSMPGGLPSIPGYTDNHTGNGTVVVDGTNATVVLHFMPITFVVSFTQHGLPAGATWFASVGGLAESSTSSSIVFNETNGSYWFNVWTSADYSVSPTSGYVIVDGGPAVTVVTACERFAVTFNETGLSVYQGIWWAVMLNGNETSSPAGTSIVFQVPNGTDPFAIVHVPGYTIGIRYGNLTIDGADLSENVTFSLCVYPVTFVVRGLPVSAEWSVYLDYVAQFSANRSIVFEVPNGTYPFLVNPVPSFQMSPEFGNVSVYGEPVTVTIEAAMVFSVTFAESGLPPGTNWSITLNGYRSSTLRSSEVFSDPNGTYSFLAASSGYAASPGSGVVTVGGADVGWFISFSALPKSGTLGEGWLGLPGYSGLALLTWMAALTALLVIATLLLLRRGRSPPPSWKEQPHPPIPPPPGDPPAY